MFGRPRDPSYDERVRAVEDAIAGVRADLDRLETEKDELEQRVGESGRWQAASLLGEIETEPDEVTRLGREHRERLREVEEETAEKIAAGHDLARRLVALRIGQTVETKAARERAAERARQDAEAAGAEYRRLLAIAGAAASEAETAERTADAASATASAVEAAIERAEPDPLVAVERARAAEQRERDRDHEARIQSCIRNPGLLRQLPHLREEVERRRPDLARAAEERNRLAELHNDALGLGRRARPGEVAERFR